MMTLVCYKKFCQQKFLFSEILSLIIQRLNRYWQKRGSFCPMVHSLTTIYPDKNIKKIKHINYDKHKI